jgi:hypothetical protein
MTATPTTSDLRTIARKPRPGDLVLSDQGHLYIAERAYHNDSRPVGRILFWAVVDFETRNRPNTIEPNRLRVVAAPDAKRLRAQNLASSR